MRYLRDYLEDLQAETEAIARFTQDGKMSFFGDQRSQYAVMMAYARIGEIVKQLPDELLQIQPEIEWRQIKGFRDILLHRYFEVNIERVWEAVEKLPALQTAIQALLENLPPDDSRQTE